MNCLHSGTELRALNADKWVPSLFKLLGVLFGVVLIVLAAASHITNMTLTDLLHYVEKVFSYSFVLLFVPLAVCAAYAIVVINKASIGREQKTFWFEVGQQAANGMSTMALTFTLLGISVGIGTLSQQSLTPDTVNDVIAMLTQQFSMAFMTTVVGLPAATLSRALLAISMVRPQRNIPQHASLMHHSQE
jgi:hypothetical protein